MTPAKVTRTRRVSQASEQPPGRAPRPRRAPPGWYRDPTGRYAQRWWTGYGWSPYARHAAVGYFDPLPAAGPGSPEANEVSAELGHLHYLEQFLERARTEHALGAEAYRSLLGRVASREQQLAGMGAAGAADSQAGAAAPGSAGKPAAQLSPGKAAVLPPQVPPATSPAAIPRQGLLAPSPRARRTRPERRPAEPAALRRWWDSARQTVRSELAVHGLAYLGVLLLFAGMFGLVAFSFSSVRVGLRPVAEAAVPLAVFGSAVLLGRRNLVVPSRALVVLGGLLLLVVTLAAFVDGAPVPPDPAGVSRVIALAAGPAALAVAYGLWARRHPATPLRHLIAPALWVAAAMAALGWVEPIPSGQQIVTPRPGQMAAVLVVIVATLAASRSAAGRRVPAALFPAGFVGLGIAALLEGLAAWEANWPALPLAISGTAVVLGLEVTGSRIHGAVRTALQGTIVVLTCAAMAPELGAGWAGAAAAAAGLAVVELSMRRAVAGPVLLVPAVVSAAGLAAAATDSAALLAASVMVAGWAHLRRIRPGGWPYLNVLTVTAAIAPAGVLVSLAVVLPADLGMAVAGLLVLTAAGCVQSLRRAADTFWSWWLPGAAVAVLAATASQEASGWVVAAAAAASAAVVLAPAPRALRVWVGSAATLWTAWLVFEVTGLEYVPRMLGIAGAALVAVGVAALVGNKMAGHLGLAGHLAGLACWPAAVVEAGTARAWVPTAVLGLAAAGAAVTTAAQETGRGAVPDLLARVGSRLLHGQTARYQAIADEALRRVPAAMTALALIPFVGFLSALLVPEPQARWQPLLLSALAIAYVLLARLLQHSWFRVARVFADVGLWAAVLAAALCAAPGPALAATAEVVVLPVIAGQALRRPVNCWAAWVAALLSGMLAANLLGLPISYWYAAALACGGVLLTGGLIADDVRSGRREPGAGVRASWLFPPVAVGAAASVAGLLGGAGAVGQPPYYIGWTLIAAAVIAGVTGLLLHAGLLGGLGAAMATGGLAAVVPRSLMDHPWMFVVVAAVWLAAAEAVRHAPGAAVRRPAFWQRWDQPLFLVAHMAATVALGIAIVTDTALALTAVLSGCLAIVISARLRLWPWAVAGTALILAGSAVAGAGWACLAFAGAAMLATALATQHRGRVRTTLQVAGAVAANGAWASALAWHDVSAAGAVEATSLAGGFVVLAAAVAVAITGAAAEWSRVWGSAGFAAILASALGLAGSAVPPDTRFFVAVSLAAAAVGFGLAAAPLRIPLLRDSAVLTALAAGTVAALGPGPVNPQAVTWVAAAAGLVASGFILAARAMSRAVPWVRPALVASGAATAGAMTGAVLAWPDRTLLVPAFVLVAVVLVDFAVALRRPSLGAAVPVPLCAAWIAYASEAVTGQPQWYTLPTGLAILAAVGLLRSARRSQGSPVATLDVIALEISGMALTLGASEVQAITRGSGYALIGAGLALALTGWGAVTHVRRRLYGGAAGFLLSLLLLVAIPLVRVAPNLGGVTVWLILAGVGAVAIVAAVLLDATRAAIKRGTARFAELTKGWE